jgi:hypothetical protein
VDEDVLELVEHASSIADLLSFERWRELGTVACLEPLDDEGGKRPGVSHGADRIR